MNIANTPNVANTLAVLMGSVLVIIAFDLQQIILHCRDGRSDQ